MNIRSMFMSSVIFVSTLGATAFAQPFEISWHTIDAGGGMLCTGGVYSLSGTIGQPDASSFSSPMTGGGYSMVGGFWTIGDVPACSCLGDMNVDGLKNGRDIQQFARCVIGSTGCDCADVDGTPGVSIDDVSVFVSSLLAGAACP